MQISQKYTNNYLKNKEVTPMSFTSRNPEIRMLDDICRKVKNEFPVMSSSKIAKYPSFGKFISRKGIDFMSNICENINLLRAIVGGTERTPAEGLLVTLKGMKTLNAGNCGEQAKAGLAACRMNGFNNVTNMKLYAMNVRNGKLRDLGHTVVGVNFDKKWVYKHNQGINVAIRRRKSMIMDAWSGIVDYADQAIVKFKNSKLIPKLEPDEQIVFLPKEQIDLTEEHIERLKSEYPNLLRNKRPAQKNKNA